MAGVDVQFTSPHVTLVVTPTVGCHYFLPGRWLSFVFGGLPEPTSNRACLVGVYAFLIWNNLCDMVYQTPTKSYQSQIPVAFGIPGHVTTKHLPDTPC